MYEVCLSITIEINEVGLDFLNVTLHLETGHISHTRQIFEKYFPWHSKETLKQFF